MSKQVQRGGGRSGQGWGLFIAGVALLLLAVFGPVRWGAAFDAELLKTPALGLIVIGAYLIAGVWLPSQIGGGWGGVIARIVAAVMQPGKKDEVDRDEPLDR